MSLNTQPLTSNSLKSLRDSCAVISSHSNTQSRSLFELQPGWYKEAQHSDWHSAQDNAQHQCFNSGWHCEAWCHLRHLHGIGSSWGGQGSDGSHLGIKLSRLVRWRCLPCNHRYTSIENSKDNKNMFTYGMHVIYINVYIYIIHVKEGVGKTSK